MREDDIIDKLKFLEDVVNYLSSLGEIEPDILKEDYTLKSAVERNLQIAIECTIDVGEMIISMEGLKRPTTYREIYLTLSQEGILSEYLGKKLADAAGFRNILVHVYGEIDLELLSEFLQDIEDFTEFIEEISEYMRESMKNH